MSIDLSTLGNDVSDQAIERLSKRILEAGVNFDDDALDGWMKEFSILSESEKNKLLTIVEEYRNSGFSTALAGLWEIDFERKPVSFEEWIDDPYYMGNLGQELYPLWVKELKYILHPRSKIVEWCITGAIGIGKTFVSLIAMLYKGAYLCSCLKNPAKYFGLASDSGIVFALFNTQLDNATLVNFQQISRFVKSSRYFQDNCPSVIKHSKSQIYWPSKEMVLKIGSSELHALGQNMFAYAMDEANFMRVTEANVDKKDEQQAHKIYDHASRRMTSRFLRYGFNPGLAIIASSRQHQTSFTEDLMRRNRSNPLFHVSDYALWDVIGREKYSPNTFRVLIGNENIQTEVLDTMDTSADHTWKYKVIPEKAQPVPSGMSYIEVPSDFYFQFVANVNGALRDQAGIATFGVDSLITRVESVSECIDKNRRHPFLKEEHSLPLKDDNADLIRFMQWDKITTIKDGVMVPIYHPGAPRFLHCDLGLVKDAAALAVGCQYDVQKRTDYDAKTGQIEETFVPKVWVDFVIRIPAVRGDEIDLGKIVRFIINLPNYGFPLYRVTFDGYASEMAIQIVRKAAITWDKQSNSTGLSADKLNLQADTLSVDKTDIPYRLLRDLLSQRCISYYHYPRFEMEVKELEHDIKKRKVDHREGGSKDTSDAVCGLAFSVSTAKIGVVMEPVIEKSSAEKTIEDETIEGIVSSYPGIERVSEVLPPPRQEPLPRQLRSGSSDWSRQLEGFGRRRKL